MAQIGLGKSPAPRNGNEGPLTVGTKLMAKPTRWLAALSFALALGITMAVAAGSWVFVDADDGSLPEARHEAAFGAVGDLLVLAGGRGIKPVDLYDPLYNQWIKGAKPPLEIHHFQAIDVDGTLWAVGAFTGGYPDEVPLANAYIFDPMGNAWLKGPEIPDDRRRGSAGAAVVDGQIYVAGGAIRGHRGGHVRWLDRLDPSTGEWTPLADAPHARDHAALVALDGKLYFVGGRLSMAPANTFGAVVPEVDVYDVASNTWETLSEPLPNPRAGNAATARNGAIYVLGGESGATADAYANVDVLDVATGRWRSGPPLQRARHGTGVAAFGRDLWIAAGSGARGGAPELNTMERLGD